MNYTMFTKLDWGFNTYVLKVLGRHSPHFSNLRMQIAAPTNVDNL